MQTKKLYYEDCRMTRFTARVCSCSQMKTGWEVVLDVTAFYPEGGGQPCDLGTLGGTAVIDVYERGDQVVHLCRQPLEEDSQVEGEIDWERRFDFMQQHTGEHIVSGLIHAAYGYHNVGFHMGADVVTIDFDGPLTMQQLKTIEQDANRAVWQDIPVKCWYPAETELPSVQYRTKKQLPWPVRIVQVPGCDSCACCGVHTATSGQVGIIKLLSCVKFHEGVRIEMVCGGRALALLDRVYEQNRLVSQAFSAKILETGSAAQRMNEQLAGEKFRADTLEKKLFDAIARDYRDRGNVVYFADGLKSTSVRELADRIARVCGGTAAVFSGSDAEGYTVCMVSQSDDLKALGAKLNQALQGRGGGKPGFFQGSIQANKQRILAFFEDL